MNFSIAVELPQIVLINPTFVSQAAPSVQTLVKMISRHPAVVAIDQKLKASQSSVDLAKQKYKPEWGVTASYGYRDASPLGQPRSDLFSVGVSFDLPLFTENRQDQQLRAATSKKASVKTQRWLVLRRLIASYNSTRAQLLRLIERQKLFKQRLLPQMHDQAEASLTAYTNDDGDFAEVVRSRIAELNARIDALNIDVDIQKNIVQLNYFLIESNNQDSDLRASNKQNHNQTLTTQLATVNDKVSELGE
ncbi:MAG: TolC family protein [Enterobacterales bacterium]|nr:TolC family protein [Enterobacterales bacterium]